MISLLKICYSSPSSQFRFEGYEFPYTLDRISKERLSGPGQIARSMPIGRAQACKTSEFFMRSFCLVKKKTSFDLQISSQIDKIMKKLR